MWNSGFLGARAPPGRDRAESLKEDQRAPLLSDASAGKCTRCGSPSLKKHPSYRSARLSWAFRTHARGWERGVIPGVSLYSAETASFWPHTTLPRAGPSQNSFGQANRFLKRAETFVSVLGKCYQPREAMEHLTVRGEKGSFQSRTGVPGRHRGPFGQTGKWRRKDLFCLLIPPCALKTGTATGGWGWGG